MDYDDDDDYDRPAAKRSRQSDGLSSTAPFHGGGSPEEDFDFNASQTDNPNPAVQQRGAAAYGGEICLRKHEKSIQDRVHGQISLHGLLVAVMDTAEFQRLDRIKQLGGCVYVYPSATHTRKEHSIGVAYLAGRMTRHLAEQQPELGIDANDILCVELAGLVHDIGHGPFSHMFEEFMKLKEGKKWEHEAMSGELLRNLINRNKIPIWE